MAAWPGSAERVSVSSSTMLLHKMLPVLRMVDYGQALWHPQHTDPSPISGQNCAAGLHLTQRGLDRPPR